MEGGDFSLSPEPLPGERCGRRATERGLAWDTNAAIKKCSSGKPQAPEIRYRGFAAPTSGTIGEQETSLIPT